MKAIQIKVIGRMPMTTHIDNIDWASAGEAITIPSEDLARCLENAATRVRVPQERDPR